MALSKISYTDCKLYMYGVYIITRDALILLYTDEDQSKIIDCVIHSSMDNVGIPQNNNLR